jgi:hypothetical protein
LEALLEGVNEYGLMLRMVRENEGDERTEYTRFYRGPRCDPWGSWIDPGPQRQGNVGWVTKGTGEYYSIVEAQQLRRERPLRSEKGRSIEFGMSTGGD